MKHPSILSKYSINLSGINAQEGIFPLRDQTQIPYIMDTLARKENHHILMHGCTSEKFQFSLIEAIALHLIHDQIPKKLHHATLIYFDVKRFRLGHETPDEILHDFHLFNEEIQSKEGLIIFVINDLSLLDIDNSSLRLKSLGQLLRSKLMDPQWRILILPSDHSYKLSYLESFFTFLRLNEPTYSEMLAVIKTFKNKIENYHHILIPDEVFSYALSLTSHYLGGKSPLDKTLELLDSSAARVSIEENSILTTSILTQVASSWSHIPLSYLHHNKFKLTQFIHHMQQKIFGQDVAINTIGSLLQTTCINFKNKSGPICNLLLTGPSGVGKNELAQALSEYLFFSTESLLHITPHKHPVSSLSEIFVTIRSDKIQHLSLLEAIQNKPYAIICFENIDESSSSLLDLFKEVFMHGYAFDKHGNTYDFRHTIIIINTILGAEKIKNLTQHYAKTNPQKITDLMQLVLNESNHTTETYSHLTQQDIHDQILPCLTGFPHEILRYLHVVPFVPLDQSSMEKIVKLKINSLAKSLEEEFNILFTYAPEVIQFLAHETLKQNDNAEPLTKLLEQHIHASIANEILTSIDDKHRPKRLVMLLNESGQMLRCEFMNMQKPTMYAIPKGSEELCY